MEPATWVTEKSAHRFDVCNGDADGLCAVRQWRLHDPAEATLITGLKREIELLQRVPIELASEVLVCDLSLQRNRVALQRLLDAGLPVRYFDHHAPGDDVPAHAALDLHIEVGSRSCTSLLVDRYLGGRFRTWALAGAYGDNLVPVADALATQSGLGISERAALRRLGEAINYNGYGETLADVCIAPAQMFELMSRYADPLRMQAEEAAIAVIDRQRQADLRQAASMAPHWSNEGARVSILPDAPWSRRVVGCLANELANAHPGQAQAVLKMRGDGGFVASVRAPLLAASGANELCAQFGGAGRAGAAGIDDLPERDLPRFVDAMRAAWPAPGQGARSGACCCSR